MFVSVLQRRSLERKCFVNECFLTASRDGPETAVQQMADISRGTVWVFLTLMSSRN